MTPSLELPAAFIAVEGSKPVFIGLVVVEPAGPNDRVRQTARAHEPLGSPLPIVQSVTYRVSDR
jgi:hypothetical protein